MSVRERGTIKWTSIMMPEQIKMLEQMWKEQEYKKKPILDEQELEQINNTLNYAISQGTLVDITYFKKHDTHQICGTLLSIDSIKRIIRLNNEDRTKIRLDDILHISLR